MWRQQTIEDYLAMLGSNQDVPGGGSAAALVGAVGAAAGLMSAYFTTDEKKFAAVLPEIREIIAQLTACKNSLQADIDHDAAAFAQFNVVYALPKNTDAEKAVRTTAMQTALANALQTPLNVMRTALGALKTLPRLAVIGNKNLITDTGVAAIALNAAVVAARLNVLINTKYLKDHLVKQNAEQEVAQIVAAAAELTAQTQALVEAAW